MQLVFQIKPYKSKIFFACLHFTKLIFWGRKKWKNQSILINPEYKNIREAHWEMI